MKIRILVLLVAIIATNSLFSQTTFKYRSTQPYLFQPVPAKTIPNIIPNSAPFQLDIFGPTYKYVDNHTGWEWINPGGDWLDSNLVSQGPKPWFSVSVASVVPLYQPVTYQGDITNIVNYVHNNGKWNAFLLVPKNAQRAIATPFDPNNQPPKIIVTYTNNSVDTLNCRLLAGFGASSTLPNTTNIKVSLSAFIEFDKPILPVLSAIIKFVVVEHWSGNGAKVEGYLLNPPTNTSPVQFGVAQNAGLLDSNIIAQNGVIGAHRYTDNSNWSSFHQTGLYNTHLEAFYDPAIYGTGPQDLTKLPHLNLGKWINVENHWSLVPSTYTAEGFVPLAPGLGALRIHMPDANIPNASAVGATGTYVGDANIYLPDSLDGEPCFGALDHIFVRYYFFLGKPHNLTTADRRQYYDGSTTSGYTKWANMAGKALIGPDHNTSYGGYSGTSGGGRGWQMRGSWYECDAGMGGPSEGGWAAGFHMFDFLQYNPPGHNYGNNGTGFELWGQKGGMNLLYAGKWYCIEIEMKLNTITTTTPGYIADGLLRTWIDGKLAYERIGMVFRTQPDVFPHNPNVTIRPARTLGVRNIKLNWYHGGKTPSTVDRTTFYTGLVWSKNYIGPMNFTTTTTSNLSNELIDETEQVNIYPNPSNGIFNISFENIINTNQQMLLKVFDLNNNLLHSELIQSNNGNSLASLDLSKYSKGIYILKITSSKLMITKKIIIE